MFNKYWVIAFVISVFASYLFGYDNCRDNYERKILEAENVWKTTTLEKERAAREAQYKIIEDYEKQVAEYEEVISEYSNKNYDIADTVSCPDNSSDRLPEREPDRKRVSETPKPKPDLTCYTRAELQRKIAESMAIAEECDKLAIRLNNLIKACSTEQK